jgi:type II secretory pathway component GspD/PulD (secretin)
MQHRSQNRPIWVCMMISAMLFILFTIAFGSQMVVITLRHRPADDVIPAISPFLSPGDTLSGQDFLLFLNTTPENLTRIQSIIAHLDQAPRQLAIMVVQGENAIDQLSTAELSGSVAIGDSTTVGMGNPRGQPHDSVTIDAQSSQQMRLSSDVQRVLVQNGATATIYVGLSAPVAMDQLTHKGMRYHQIQGYREMLTGVQVTPRTSGNRVTLGIKAQQDQPAGNGSAAVRHQQIQTQIQGQLNEWIDIGSILGASNSKADRLDTRSTSQQSSQRHIFVKVTEIHP